MANGNFGVCAGCRQQIMWIRTRAGKNMPVNPQMLSYRADPSGVEKIVTQYGDVVTGVTGVDPEQADGIGYISHFATCPQSRNYRRKRA